MEALYLKKYIYIYSCTKTFIIPIQIPVFLTQSRLVSLGYLCLYVKNPCNGFVIFMRRCELARIQIFLNLLTPIAFCMHFHSLLYVDLLCSDYE